MTLQNAVKNAKIEGKPRIVNPTANSLEVTVTYEAVNGSRQIKKTDFLVRLNRYYDPAKEAYVPEIDPEARKKINEGGYINPVVSAIPMGRVNGEAPELADVVIVYFKDKFVAQYQ